jgi:hypothetical protein
MKFKCEKCGEVHESLPDIGFGRPDLSLDVPEEERAERVKGNDDWCVVDDEYFFVRAVAQVAVHGEDDAFGVGIWVSLSRKHFEIYKANPETDKIGPFVGWVSNQIEFYEGDTRDLKAKLWFRGGNKRPLADLEPTQHPLAVAQQEGLSLEQAWDIVHFYMQ